MATRLDISAADGILKEYYTNQRVTEMMYKDMPLYAMLEKVKTMGRNHPLPMRVTTPQGRSATFSNAQSNKTSSVYREFLLTRKTDYAVASITTETILASKSDAGAFLRAATNEIDGALMSLKRSLGWAIYGDGSGSLGSISAYVLDGTYSVGKLTLTNVEDIVKFEIGQTLEARSGATARLFATGVSTAMVTKVDRDNGLVYLDNTTVTGGTIVANDTVNVVGDYNAKLSGLKAWIPDAAPSATSFFGVDRSIDATRLGGIRVSSSGKPIDEAFIDAARRAGREGASPDHGFVGFSRYAALEKTLSSRVIYKDVEVAGVGFRGIEVSGPAGSITILPDRDCPEDHGYLLQMDSLAFYSLEEPVMLIDLDGNRMLRESSADAFEVRCASYSQMGSTFPGANTVLLF